MGLYSATKKNEVMSFSGERMELKNVLSEVSVAQKDKQCMLFLIQILVSEFYVPVYVVVKCI